MVSFSNEDKFELDPAKHGNEIVAVVEAMIKDRHKRVEGWIGDKDSDDASYPVIVTDRPDIEKIVNKLLVSAALQVYDSGETDGFVDGFAAAAALFTKAVGVEVVPHQ